MPIASLIPPSFLRKMARANPANQNAIDFARLRPLKCFHHRSYTQQPEHIEHLSAFRYLHPLLDSLCLAQDMIFT